MSVSKSMGGIGFGLQAKAPAKKAAPKKMSTVSRSSNLDDGYSDDAFESMADTKSLSISQSNKVTKKSLDKAQCPKCLNSFAKAKLAQHMGTCKPGDQENKGKFSNYSPIKEADDEGRYQEDSKTSSAKLDSSKKLKGKNSSGKKSVLESSGGADSSSQSNDLQSQKMAQKLQNYMKNDYNVSVSASNALSKSKGRSNADSDDEYDTSYNTTSMSMSNSANIQAKINSKMASNFQALMDKYKVGSNNLDGVSSEDEDSSDSDTDQ